MGRSGAKTASLSKPQRSSSKGNSRQADEKRKCSPLCGPCCPCCVESPGSPRVSPDDAKPFQNVVEVPMYQEVTVKNRVIETPEVHVIEKFRPVIQIQDVIRHVPRIETVIEEKYVEVPEVKVIEKRVHVPQLVEHIREVPRVVYEDVIREVPVPEIQYVDKIVEVEQLEMVDRIVEVEQFEEVPKYVEVVTIVEVPQERIIHVPRVEIQYVEKIVDVPGPVEVVNCYYDVPVEVPVVQIVEKIVEREVFEDIIRMVECPRNVPGPVIEIPHERVVEIEKPIITQVKGRTIRQERKVPVEKIVHVEVPEYHEVTKVIRTEVPRPKEVIFEVEEAEYVDEEVIVPEYVYVRQPPQIIRPNLIQDIRELPPTVETGAPTYVYEPSQMLPPVYETLPDALLVEPDMTVPPNLLSSRGLQPSRSSNLPPPYGMMDGFPSSRSMKNNPMAPSTSRNHGPPTPPTGLPSAYPMSMVLNPGRPPPLLGPPSVNCHPSMVPHLMSGRGVYEKGVRSNRLSTENRSTTGSTHV